MRTLLVVLVALRIFAVGILPAPLEAAVGSDAPIAAPAIVPGLVPARCIDVEAVVRAAGEAAMEHEQLVTYRLEQSGIATTATFTVWGAPAAIQFRFVDGCLVERRIVPAELRGPPGVR